MSRRQRHWRKLLKQCGGDATKLEQILPDATIIGAGRYLGKGSPGSCVTLPMGSKKRSLVKKAIKR